MKPAMIYAMLLGPVLWISLVLGAAGIVLKIIRLLRISASTGIQGEGVVSKPEALAVSGGIAGSRAPLIARIRIAVKNSLAGRDPFLAVVSMVFHGCVITVPLFLTAHSVLLFQSWRLRIVSMPEALSDILAMTVIFCAVLLMMRRLFLKRVRLLTSFGDNAVLAVTVTPFITGALAYHQAGPYDAMIILHILSGEILIIALGWTRLSHPVFFFFTRFFIGGEYSLGRGRRGWISGLRRREGLYG